MSPVSASTGVTARPNGGAVGDASGTVHFLAKQGGATQLRLPTDGSGIVGAPVLARGTMLVVTRSGGLFALRNE